MAQDYDESAIKVLKDIEHVRLRPLMYINSERPKYQMFTEILDNSIDEAMNGFATRVNVLIDYENDLVQVIDDGRGLPQGINVDLKIPTPIVIYTKLNSGGKYDTSVYDHSGGLHGVGSTVVNALSEYMNVLTWRGEDRFYVEFERGEQKAVKQDKDIGNSGSGTAVVFKPDDTLDLFSDTLEDYKRDIEDRLALLVTIVPGLTITYQGEIVQARPLSQFLTDTKQPLFEEALFFNMKNLMVAVNWSEDVNRSTQRSYCNSIYNPLGGDHERGVYDALTEVLKTDDALLGVNIAVSVMYPEVEFDTQAKLKATSKDMRKYVKDTFSSELKQFLKKNPPIQDAIIKLVQKKRQDINKRNNKSAVKRDRKSSFLNSLMVDGFSDCTTSDRSTAELYIVEGKSAAGSARQSRDTATQAVLPLRGKVLNVMTSDVAAILKNAEFGTLISSIDAGVFEDVNIAKSRFARIIVMADADEDGKDIASHLIGFFTKCMPEFIEMGYVYLALPPLYGTTVGGNFIPINDDADYQAHLKAGHKITRFKGLGEMDPAQLKVACMDSTTRELLQVTRTPDCAKRISEILGGDSQARKDLLKSSGVLI